MNWKQLYTSSSTRERLDALIVMLRIIDTRHRVLPADLQVIKRPRRIVPYHVIHDRRRPAVRVIYLTLFVFILVTLFAGTITVSTHVPPIYAAPILLFLNFGLLGILIWKPYKRTLTKT